MGFVNDKIVFEKDRSDILSKSVEVYKGFVVWIDTILFEELYKSWVGYLGLGALTTIFRGKNDGLKSCLKMPRLLVKMVAKSEM